MEYLFSGICLNQPPTPDYIQPQGFRQAEKENIHKHLPVSIFGNLQWCAPEVNLPLALAPVTVLQPSPGPGNPPQVLDTRFQVCSRKFKVGICCGGHLAITYGGELLYLQIFS